MHSDRSAGVSPQAFILAGVSATLAWELWSRVVVPELGSAALAPADFVMSLFDLPDSYRWLGELVHYLTALVILPLVYTRFLLGLLPGPALLRGTVCGLLLFLVSLGLVVPMGGVRPFLGFGEAAQLYLVGEVLYGLALVIVYDASTRR